MEALGINLGYVILQICMFVIVFVTLRAWIYKPMLGLLEKRRKMVSQGLEDARVAAEARANAEVEANKIIGGAQSKAAEIIKEATDRAESAGQDLRARMEAEVAKSRQEALTEMAQEKNRILSELRGQVAALAIAATQKLIGESLDEARQRALLQDFFSGVKSGKVEVLQGKQISGEKAEVTSALPLVDKEQTTIRKELLSSLGEKGEIEFKVDPSILGGLIIRTGETVIDGSVAGQLESLKNSLV